MARPPAAERTGRTEARLRETFRVLPPETPSVSVWGPSAEKTEKTGGPSTTYCLKSIKVHIVPGDPWEKKKTN